MPIGAAVLGGAFLVAKTVPLGDWGAVAVVAVGAAVLLLALTTGPAVGRPAGPVTRWTSAYAQCSFSLYAIHVPLLALAAAWWVPDAAGRWQPSSASVGAAVGLVVAVGAAAAVFAVATEQRTDQVRAALGARSTRTSGGRRPAGPGSARPRSRGSRPGTEAQRTR